MDKFEHVWFPQPSHRTTDVVETLRNSNWKLLVAIDPSIEAIKFASPSFGLWDALQRACVHVARKQNNYPSDKHLVELLSWMISVVDITDNFPTERDWENLLVNLQGRIDKSKLDKNQLRAEWKSYLGTGGN